VISAKDVHSRKMPCPILVRLGGSVISLRDVHPCPSREIPKLPQTCSIYSTPAPKVLFLVLRTETVCNFDQPAKHAIRRHGIRRAINLVTCDTCGTRSLSTTHPQQLASSYFGPAEAERLREYIFLAVDSGTVQNAFLSLPVWKTRC